MKQYKIQNIIHIHRYLYFILVELVQNNQTTCLGNWVLWYIVDIMLKFKDFIDSSINNLEDEMLYR